MKNSAFRKWNLFYTISGKRAFCAVFLLVIFQFFTAYSQIVFSLKTGSAVSFFQMGNIGGGFFPVFYAVAAYPAIAALCQECKTGSWKGIQIRLGTDAYVTGRIWTHYLGTAFLMALGLAGYFLLTILIAMAAGRPLYNLPEMSLQLPDQPFWNLFYYGTIYMLSAGFWSVVAMLVAIWRADLFFSIITPMMLNLLLGYLSNYFSAGGLFTRIELLYFGMPSMFWNWIFACMIILLLTGVTLMAANWLLRKRVKYEITS